MYLCVYTDIPDFACLPRTRRIARTLRIQRKFEEPGAYFVSIFLTGRNCAVAVRRNEKLDFHNDFKYYRKTTRNGHGCFVYVSSLRSDKRYHGLYRVRHYRRLRNKQYYVLVNGKLRLSKAFNPVCVSIKHFDRNSYRALYSRAVRSVLKSVYRKV